MSDNRTTPVPITVAHGDGAGPEIMRATLRIIEAASARLDCEVIDIGEKMYTKGRNAGIEHRQSEEVYQCLKIITRPGTEKIVRYAFDYARQRPREGDLLHQGQHHEDERRLFHRVFDESSAVKLANKPQDFDAIVMLNLYDDILSDVAAEIAASVGLAGSANIGEICSMFEAIHGSAPRRAGQNVANPSGLLPASALMLNHIGQAQGAERTHNAWLRTVEDGIHTDDIFREGVSKQQVSTSGFAGAVIARLGQTLQTLKPVAYQR